MSSNWTWREGGADGPWFRTHEMEMLRSNNEAIE